MSIDLVYGMSISTRIRRDDDRLVQGINARLPLANRDHGLLGRIESCGMTGRLQKPRRHNANAAHSFTIKCKMLGGSRYRTILTIVQRRSACIRKQYPSYSGYNWRNHGY